MTFKEAIEKAKENNLPYEYHAVADRQGGEE